MVLACWCIQSSNTKSITCQQSLGEDTPSESDVLREYDRDKWGKILEQIKTHKEPSLEAVEEGFFGSASNVGCIGGTLLYGQELELHRMYMTRTIEIVSNLCANSDVVEIGAGYGAYALRLARSDSLVGRPRSIVPLEWTPAGRECLKLLRPPDFNLRVGSADYNAPSITNENLPNNAVFLTGMAIPHLLSDNMDNFLSWIQTYNPRLVVHVEPIVIPNDHTDLGLLRARYMEYIQCSGCLMLLSAVENLASRGVICIEEGHYEVVGSNALLPVSIIAWSPSGRRKSQLT